MPQNITDANAFTAPIVAPADGDPEGAASVLVSLQGLANRTNYIMQMLGGSTSFSRNALNGFAGLNGSGLVGTGFLPQGANGVCILDGSAKVPNANLRNGIFSVQKFQVATGWSATYQSTTSATAVDVTSSAQTVASCAVGDIVIANATFGALTDAAGIAVYQFAIVDGGTPVAQPQTVAKTNVSSSTVQMSLSCTYVVTVGGSVTTKMQFFNDGTHNAYVNGTVQMTVMIIRP